MERGVIIDIINIVDRLESLIDTSKVMPVGGNVLLDKKKTLELVDQLRLAIPRQIKAAEEVLGQKDHILNQAVSEARRTKAKAEDDYRDRVNTNEINGRAQQKADETLAEAEERVNRMLLQCEQEAKARLTEADAYALRSLRALEKHFRFRPQGHRPVGPGDRRPNQRLPRRLLSAYPSPGEWSLLLRGKSWDEGDLPE